MSVQNKKIIFAAFLVLLSILACNMPGAAPATEAPAASATATFTPIAAISETPSPTATTVSSACTPTVTTSVVANVRSGPGQIYAIIGTLPQGGTATVAGKSFDGTWWYIEFAGGTGGYGWISTSVTNSACIPDTLASIAAPPTPIVPTGVPSSTAVAEVEEPSATPPSGGGGIILLPPIFLINTPTPTPIIWFIPPIIIQP